MVVAKRSDKQELDAKLCFGHQLLASAVIDQPKIVIADLGVVEVDAKIPLLLSQVIVSIETAGMHDAGHETNRASKGGNDQLPDHCDALSFGQPGKNALVRDT